MTSRRVFGLLGLALAAMLGLSAAQPALAEPLPKGRVLSRAEAPPARRAARAEAPLPTLCDGPGPSQVRRVLFNHAELDDPGAEPALQSAVQLCISAAPAGDRPRLRGPVWRG